MAVEIFLGDALHVLRTLEDEQFHMCVTSPPYWGLRDYDTPPQVWGGDTGCEHIWSEATRTIRNNSGQGKSTLNCLRPGYIPPYHAEHAGTNTEITSAFCSLCDAWHGNLGLEPTPSLYVQHLVEICREIRRVLRDDGTFWLNLGDSFAGSGAGGGGNRKGNEHGQHDAFVEIGRPKVSGDLKPKDLVGIPWMIAFALRDDGWWLRMDNVWAKGCSFGEHKVRCPHCGKKHTARYSGSVMPESVRDRPTKGHEYVFLFSKSQRYFYNYYAVKEPIVASSLDRAKYSLNATINPDPHDIRHGEGWKKARAGATLGEAGFVDPKGRNVRSVWQINSAQFPEAHYAVFPEELIEHPIAASTSDYGCCIKCESPWKQMSKKTGAEHKREPAHVPGNTDTKVDSTGWAPTTETLDYSRPTCKCGTEETIPCLVLDPFGGRGTTAVVAAKHNCDSVLIELSGNYVLMAKEWISKQVPDVPIYIAEEEE